MDYSIAKRDFSNKYEVGEDEMDVIFNPSNLKKHDIEESYDDITEDNIIYLPGQKALTKEDYQDFFYKSIAQNPITLHDLVAKVNNELHMDVGNFKTVELMQDLLKSGKVEASASLPGYEVYHMPGNDPNKSAYDEIVALIKDQGGFVKASKIIKQLSSKYYITNDNVKIILDKMAKNDLIYYIGDTWNNMYLSLEKDVAAPSMENEVTKFLQKKMEDGYPEISGRDIYYYLNKWHDVETYAAQDLLEKMADTGKVFKTDDDEGLMFWASKYSLTQPNPEQIAQKNSELKQKIINLINDNGEGSILPYQVHDAGIGTLDKIKKLMTELVTQGKLFYYHNDDWAYGAKYTLEPIPEGEDAKQAILQYVSKQKTLAINILSDVFKNVDYNKVQAMLEEMAKEGKLVKTVTDTWDFWNGTIFSMPAAAAAAAPVPQPTQNPGSAAEDWWAQQPQKKPAEPTVQ